VYFTIFKIPLPIPTPSAQGVKREYMRCASCFAC
jgi:hypothetical protein